MLRSGLILRPAADAHSGPLSPLEVNTDMKRFEPWWTFRASAMPPKPINPCSSRIYGLLFWGQESGGMCISGRPRRPMNQARRVAQQPAATGCEAAVIQPASSAGGPGQSVAHGVAFLTLAIRASIENSPAASRESISKSLSLQNVRLDSVGKPDCGQV